MINRIAGILMLFILSQIAVRAQDSCHITFHGHVGDSKTDDPLQGVVVAIIELNKTAITDSIGVFKFTDVCAGKYTFICQYLGYEKYETTIAISQYSHPSFGMVISSSSPIVIKGERKKEEVITVPHTNLEGVDLDKTRGESLGDALKDITGLNSIQTGPGVSKPVIHGLHSNRILILNNGVRQEGQQWGTDHAPEVDPFIASDISVIKGAASIRYGSDAIAGVILLQPKKMPENPGIDGEVNLVGASNNGLGAGSAMLEGAFDKKLTGLSWRVQGTYRIAGNSEAPNYYLDNTGFREGDISSEIAYKKDDFGIDAYYSHFGTQIGILTASHIGNTNDLYLAFSSPQPIERSVFSYDIGRPYQVVNHDLLKTSAYFNLASGGRIELLYAMQQDIRSEYSPDISYNDSIAKLNLPQLFFDIVTHTVDFAWFHPAFKSISGSIGITGITQANVYQGADYFSIIPNFQNYGGGIYAIEKWTKDKLTVEGGIRYDYKWLKVYMYNINLKLVEPVHEYSNFTTSLGATYQFNDKFSVNFNYGSAWRPPGPNELYGQGIHISAAAFEKGDSTLGVEKAYNFSVSAKFQIKRFSAELGLYNNIINNFIFLNPAGVITLISGTYPEFQYTQANVVFRGIDLDLKYYILPELNVYSKSTIIRSFNYTINNYLVFTPADRFENGIRYEIKNLKKIKKFYVGVSNVYVAHQDRVPPNSDFVPPPPAYTLFDAEMGGFLPIFKRDVEINLSVNNIANTAYRDYLDRLRYFSDEPGRTIMLKLKIPLFIKKQTNDSN